MTDAKHAKLVAFLKQQGYLPPDAEPSDARFIGAIEGFQRKMGLIVDGVPDIVTERFADAPRFCSVPDNVNAGQKCRWDGTERPLEIRWSVTGSLPGIPAQKLIEVYNAAWLSWMRVCGIMPSYVPNASEAHVRMGSGRIDGASGTLAWSQLPCGPDQPLQQKYDSGEPWFTGLGRPTNGRISLRAVACHEIGHVIGLDHLSQGNLLAPYYTADILEPQAGDIEEAVLRYGPPVAAPLPPEPDTPDVLIEFGGKIYRAREVTIKAA